MNLKKKPKIECRNNPGFSGDHPGLQAAYRIFVLGSILACYLLKILGMLCSYRGTCLFEEQISWQVTLTLDLVPISALEYTTLPPRAERVLPVFLHTEPSTSRAPEALCTRCLDIKYVLNE